MGRKTTAHMDLARANPREYAIWIAMKQRCGNPRHAEFHNYGARGVSVCLEWQLSFESFLADMGSKPEGMSLDRINNSLGYSKQNCCWRTIAQQNRNKRDNHLLTFGGETMCLTDWADRLGIHHQTLRNRLKRGWATEEALTTGRITTTRDPATGLIQKR